MGNPQVGERRRWGRLVIRWTVYTLAFALGFTLALAGLLVALTLWALGVRFNTEESDHVSHPY